eukprot:5294310-Prymnesium_polylepis.1
MIRCTNCSMTNFPWPSRRFALPNHGSYEPGAASCCRSWTRGLGTRGLVAAAPAAVASAG